MKEFKTNFKDITLALDLALSSPGFAVLATFEGKPIVLESGFIKTNPKDIHGNRLKDIYNEIERYLKTYEPEHIVREKGFSRFAATTQTLFKVVGISDYVVAEEVGLSVHEIPPTTVKKLVTGDGRATKEEVAEEVFKILQIDNKDEYYRTKRNGDKELLDDKTDACAVGIAYLKQKGRI